MINLTVQSLNSKDIIISDINNFSMNTSFLNNETINLNYSNYIVSVFSNMSSINYNNFFGSLSDFTKDAIFLILTAGLLTCLYFGIRLLKRLES